MSFFFVLCGLHCVINAARANNIGSLMGSVLVKALDQWIATWKIQLDNVSVEESSKLGFMKDAGIEFWQLATIFVRAEALGMFDSDELRNMSAESMEGVSCLLEVFYLADTNTSRRCSSGKVLESLDDK
ncbi:hypothetical protein LTR47_000505 [Exophiala xenobiotica]|nr:hypothetical protein LTR47_000505 [Exophiala xenobiotica]KAK5387569.1 hypothetical protein LTR11_001234 [Exophiala xenobiotica]KAK5388929.1 hypothetical protein LTS03_001350 [Exophiala xenobiotica]